MLKVTGEVVIEFGLVETSATCQGEVRLYDDKAALVWSMTLTDALEIQSLDVQEGLWSLQVEGFAGCSEEAYFVELGAETLLPLSFPAILLILVFSGLVVFWLYRRRNQQLLGE